MSMIIIFSSIVLFFTGIYSLIGDLTETEHVRKLKAATVQSESSSILVNEYRRDSNGNRYLYNRAKITRRTLMKNGDTYFEEYMPVVDSEGNADL